MGKKWVLRKNYGFEWVKKKSWVGGYFKAYPFPP